jgi:hypothetical protein
MERLFSVEGAAMAQLTCPNCGEGVAAKNINIQKTLALCESCGTVFNFGDQFAAALEKGKRRKLKQPEQVTVHDAGDDLSLSFKWSFKAENPIILFFVGALLLIGLAFVLIGLRGGAAGWPLGLTGLLMSAFPAYSFLAIASNTTTVTARGETLIHETRPLPYPRYTRRVCDLADVESAFTRSAQVLADDFYHDIRLRHQDGSETIFMGQVERSHAVFIAAQINAYLAALAHEADGALAADALPLLDEADTDSPILTDGELPRRSVK